MENTIYYIQSKRRRIVNLKTGRFGFVHESESKDDTVEIYYPFPKQEIIKEKISDIDFNIIELDGLELENSYRESEDI